MVLNDKPYTFDRVMRLAVTAGLIWGLIWLLGYLSDVLIPFAVAFLMAYLINPLVNLVQRKIPRRVPAVFISLFIVFLGLALAGFLIVPMIVNEISHMGRVLSDLVNNSALAARATKLLPPDLWQWIKDFAAQEEVQQFFRTDSFMSLASTVGKKIMPGVWGFIAGTANFLLGLLGLTLIGLYLVFLLLDYHRVREGWKELIPESHREAVVGFVRDFDLAMNRYFRAQAVVAGIVGMLTATGFALIGLPMGILLGLFIGLLNMAPYLQIIGFPPALLLAVVHALEVGGDIWVYMGLVLLVFAVVQIIQDAFLVPKIMGDVTGFSPAVILLSLSIWGKLLGMLGLLIALPMTALLNAYYQRFFISTADRTPPATSEP